jgi:hypothetical protein
MAQWIRKSLGPHVPLHLGRFVPKYKLSHLPQTPIQTLEDARKIRELEEELEAYKAKVAEQAMMIDLLKKRNWPEGPGRIFPCARGFLLGQSKGHGAQKNPAGT